MSVLARFLMKTGLCVHTFVYPCTFYEFLIRWLFLTQFEPTGSDFADDCS